MAHAQSEYEKVQRFKKVDDHLATLIRKFALLQAERLSETPRLGPWYKEHSFLAGSQVEGGSYARMFRYDEVKHVLEIDVMFEMGIVKKPINQLQPINHSPGYFLVRINGTEDAFYDGVKERILGSSQWKQHSGDKFLACSTVMEFLNSMFISTPSKSKANKFMAHTVLQPTGHVREEVSFPHKGPSVVTSVRFTSDGEHLIEILVDTVCCFKLSSWPDEWGFREWRNRKRKWPDDQNVIEEIQHLIHIVPKRTPDITESERANSWRLSFSKAEMYLKSLFSSCQHEVYLLFKILFYANITKIEIGEKKMPSYFCKTTMLWMMEEEGPDFGKSDFVVAIQRLFRKFKQFLDRKDGLPSFFYPQINLLEGYPEDLVKECSKIADKVMQHPLDHLPSHFVSICEHLERLDKRISDIEFESFMDDLNDFIEGNSALRGATAIEVFLAYMQPRNWRVRLLFHPFVRALMVSWVRIKFHFARRICCGCLPSNRSRQYSSYDEL